MSKSTKKHGTVRFVARLTSDVNPQPNQKLLSQWAKLDRVAFKMFGKQYDALTEAQKSALHLNINTERIKNRNRQSEKDADVDARLDREEYVQTNQS